MDPDKIDGLLAALDEMAGMMAKIRESISGDAAEEQSEAVDQATAPEVAEGDDDSQVRSADDKQTRKAAMVSMLKKNI